MNVMLGLSENTASPLRDIPLAFLHCLMLQVDRHFFDGVSQGRPGHGGFVFQDISENLGLVLQTGFLQQPSVAFCTRSS